MRNKIFMLGVLALILASTALAYVPTQKINFQNVSDPQRLERLLNDQFNALKDDISGLYFSGTGNFFYVDSNVGSSSYTGTDWIRPKATLDSAVALCTANNGDVIFVASGHAENLAAANAVDLDVAGITVVGLGTAADRPKFTYTNAAGEFVIGASSVSVYNLQFVPGVTSVLTAIDIEAAGDSCLIQGCDFLESATAADEFLSIITLASGSDKVSIVGNRFVSDDDGATGGAITIVAGVVNDLIVKDNYFYGDWDTACIYSDQINLNCLIDGNIATNLDTGQYAIEFSGAATGVCSNNFMVSDVITNVLDPGSLNCFNNYGTTGIDTPAQPIPISTSAIVGNADGTPLERMEIIQSNQGISYNSPRYLTVTADMTSATWNTAAAHSFAAVTGVVRVQFMVECPATIITTSTDGTIALGYVGNASAISAAQALDAVVTGDVLSSVYGSAGTSPASGGDAMSALTHCVFDVIAVNGNDLIYTIATHAATTGSLKFHIWWTPISSTGAVTAGAGGTGA